MSAWKALADRPATGRSFVLILIVAGVAALAVTIWTFRSAGKARRDGAAADAFRI
jgi:cbb3-type cytochrome oxidase subunit 3